MSQVRGQHGSCRRQRCVSVHWPWCGVTHGKQPQAWGGIVPPKSESFFLYGTVVTGGWCRISPIEAVAIIEKMKLGGYSPY